MNVKVVGVDAYRIDGYLISGGRAVRVATALHDAWGWVIQAALRHPQPHRRSPAGYRIQTVHRVDTTGVGAREAAEQLLRLVCLRRSAVGPD